MAIANVIISIPLANSFGAIGAAMGTAISLVFCNGLIMNFFYHKVLKINMIYFWKEILKTLKGMLIPIISAGIIMRFVKFTSLTVFFVSIIVFAVVYCASVFAFSCNREEKDMICCNFRKDKI